MTQEQLIGEKVRLREPSPIEQQKFYEWFQDPAAFIRLNLDQPLIRPEERVSSPRQIAELAAQLDIAALRDRLSLQLATEEARTWAIFARKNGPVTVEFAVADKLSDELVGAVWLTLSRRHRTAEVRTIIRAEGRGYATEAKRLARDYAFSVFKLATLYSDYLEGNAATARINAKLGFQIEGRRRSRANVLAGREDLVCTSILYAEWLALKIGEQVAIR